MKKVTSSEHKITPQEALDIIHDERGLIKLIPSPLDTSEQWDFNLNQLANPDTVRAIPRRPLKLRHVVPDRSRIFNPISGQWESRHIPVSATRGMKKYTGLTKKTSTSLLPSDGIVVHFTCMSSPVPGPSIELPSVGILFDVDKVYELNEKDPARASKQNFKYVFDADAFTIRRWWLSGYESIKGDTYLASTLQDIRRKNREDKSYRDSGIEHKSAHNEFFIRVAASALRGVFATKDEAKDRLNALQRKYEVRKKITIDGLPLDLPLLIVTPSTGAIEYPLSQQAHDLVDALQDRTDCSESMITNIMESIQNADNLDLIAAVETLKSGAFSEIAYQKMLKDIGKHDYSGMASYIELYGSTTPLEKLRNVFFNLVRNGQYAHATQLLKKNTDPTLTLVFDPVTGDLPIHVLVRSALPNLELIDLLCSAGRKFTNHAGDTAFDIAEAEKKYGVIGVMLKYFTDAELHAIRLPIWTSALLCSFQNKQYDVAKKILSRLSSRQLETVKFITDPKTNNYLLHIAVLDSSPDLELIDLLLEECGWSYKNFLRQTAFELAVSGKKYTVTDLMLNQMSVDEVAKLFRDAVLENNYEMLQVLLSGRDDLTTNKKFDSIKFESIFAKMIGLGKYDIALLILEKRPYTAISVAETARELLKCKPISDTQKLIEKMEELYPGKFSTISMETIRLELSVGDYNKIPLLIERYSEIIPVKQMALILWLLVSKKQYDLACRLLKKIPGPELGRANNQNNKFPIHLAVNDTTPNLELIILLSKIGVNQKDKAGKTAFEDAVKLKRYQIVTIMMQYATEAQIGVEFINAVHAGNVELLQAMSRGRTDWLTNPHLSAFADYATFILGHRKIKMPVEFGRKLPEIAKPDFGLNTVLKLQNDSGVILTAEQQDECFLLALQHNQISLAEYLLPSLMTKKMLSEKIDAAGNYAIHLALLADIPSESFVKKILAIHPALPVNVAGKTPLDIALTRRLSDAMLKMLAIHFFSNGEIVQHHELLQRLMGGAQYHYLDLMLKIDVFPLTRVMARYPTTENYLIHIAVFADAIPLPLFIRLSQAVLHLKNKAGKTPIDLALQRWRPDMVSTMLNNISDEQTSIELNEILFSLVNHKEYGLARLLLKNRPDTALTIDAEDAARWKLVDLILADTAPDIDLIIDLIRLEKIKKKAVIDSVVDDEVDDTTILDYVLENYHDAIKNAVIKKMISTDSDIVLAYEAKLLWKIRKEVKKGSYALPRLILQHQPDLFKNHPLVKQGIIFIAGTHVTPDWSFIDLVNQSGVVDYSNKGTEKGSSGLVKLIYNDKVPDISALLKREPLLVVGMELDLAIKRNALDAVNAILEERIAKLKPHDFAKALDFIFQQSPINLSFLNSVAGSLQEKRQLAFRVIDYLLAKANDTDQVHAIVAQLESLKVNYLYARQGSSLSLGRHAWNGEDVSRTWVNIMKRAKNRVIAISTASDKYYKPQDIEFIKKKRNKWAGSFFFTESEKAFRANKEAAIYRVIRP